MLLKVRKYLVLIVAILCLVLSTIIFKFTPQTTSYYKEQDIYAHYKASGDIAKGTNPYLAILNSNMQTNNKYSTYMAGFYYLILPTVKIYPDFNNWINFWKTITIIFYSCVGFLIFYNAYKKTNVLLAVVLALVWFFNRWSIYLATTLIFLLLLTLILIKSKPKLSLLTFGIQIALKHLTLFLLPLMLIQTAQKNIKITLKHTLLVLIPALIVSIKFLIQSPTAYLQSVLFTTTRIAEDHFKVTSLSVGEIFNLYGIYERLPMVFAIFFVYYLFAKKKIEFYLSVVLVLLISITFNPVFFLQYEAWFIAVLLFYLAKVSIKTNTKL